MIKQSKYWERVERAAQAYVLMHRELLSVVTLEYTVLPEDVLKRLDEMEEEQDEQTG